MKSFRIAPLVNLLVLAVILSVTVAEVLEDSGHPMKGTNPQRNYQSTRKVLCPDVATGRSQVMNVAWTFPPESASYFTVTNEPTIDSSGNVFVIGSDYTTSYIFKLNGITGSVLSNITTSEELSVSQITHVKGNKFYYATSTNAYTVDSTTMNFIGSPIPMPAITNPQYSFAPYLSTHMVSTNQGLSGTTISDNILTYIKVSDRTVDSTQFNFIGGNPQPVLVYKNTTTDMPIVVSTTGLYPDYVVVIKSPEYEMSFAGEFVDRAWIEGDYLQMFTKNALDSNTVRYYVFHAATGKSLSNITIDLFGGKGFSALTNLFAVNNRSIAQIYNTGTLKNAVVDLLNNRTLLPQQYVTLPSAPLYSIPDNTMVLYSSLDFERLDLIGLDWDNLDISFKGSFPSDNIFSDFVITPPVIGEDCHVYTNFNGRLFAFAPLPIQNIVPILECVNQDGVGYFSYDNLGDIDVVIPQFFDRNYLSPLNVTPGIDFAGSRRGKYFPLSFRVDIGNSGTFTWQLEDYILKFNVNSSLLCPQTVKFKIVLTANGTFPATFGESVRLLFASVVGINETRVTSLTRKRYTEQSQTDLEVELQVAPDATQTELSPEEAIQKLVQQQSYNFNYGLPKLPDAPPDVITKDVDGLPLSTEIKGEIPPQPPITAPVSPPQTTSTPTNPQTPTKVSSCNIISLSMASIITVLGLVICN